MPELANTIDPALAVALVAVQAEVETIPKGGWNDQRKYSYATADAVTAAARKLLTKHGLAWVRTKASTQAPKLSQAAIGNQSYVGEVAISGLIVHTGGGVLPVSAETPIIVKPATPHDKGGAASITFGTGYLLLGVMNADREGQHTVDGRGDGEGGEDDDGKAPPSTEPLCTGRAAHIATTNAARCEELAATLRKDKRVVWARACKASNVPMEGGEYPSPQQLYVSEGLRVSALLKSHLEDQPQPETERQPGDDGDDTGAPY